VTLLYFDDCPNWKAVDRHLRVLAAEFDGLTISRQLIETTEQAERVGFRGSPSILVDGSDPFADPVAPVGLACRVYSTPNGLSGSPTLDQLRRALHAADPPVGPTVDLRQTPPAEAGDEERTATPSASWFRRRDAVRLILRGVTFHTASRVALVVGTLLTIVNQGAIIVHGDQTSLTWVRVAANYAIPYVVASIGYLTPLRRRGHR
jgi:hypothetical protein